MRPPERVLLVWYAPFRLGGVQTFMLHFAREAIALGSDVWVAAVQDSGGPLRDSFEATGAQLLDWSAFASAFARQGDQERVKRHLAAHFSRLQPTLVLLNDCNDFSIGAAPLLEQVRRHATLIDIFHIDSPDPRYLDFRQYFVHVVDGIAGTNSHVLQRFASDRAAYRSVATDYIPNGVAPCDAEHALPQEPLSLLYVGRLAQDQKRVLLLPELFAQLRARGRAFRATICGEGPAREQLELAIAGIGLSTQVVLTGYRTPAQVQKLMLEHDVLVNVSSFEGFSMSLLEALAAGCVPTCTHVESIDPERLVHGWNCLLVPPDQPGKLVDEWLSLTPQRVAALAVAARASSRALSARACVERYLAFATHLRAARPTLPWAGAPELRTPPSWDLARDNPWLARRPTFLRGALRALRRSVGGT